MAAIDDLLKKRDAARALMKTAMVQEEEAGDRLTMDPASFAKWQMARDAFKQALRHYESAQNAYMEARRIV